MVGKIDPANGRKIIEFLGQRSFVHDFKLKMGYIPGYQPAEEYDIVHMVAYAIERVGYDGEKIRDVLANLKDFPSAMGGKVSMFPDHYTRPTLGLWLVRHGSLVKATA